ncbi:MAG: glycosyltransferase [Oculatellaceae cyanobacterium Prado106]|jgi:hypothetical protein|nr:glycosyltransferase [Oculatellaceae cyanobacterium Prado106]
MFQRSPARPIQYPPIVPIADAGDRPVWSVMITAYHRTTYLEQAILSVLNQGFSEKAMQIEVVDDCSATDDIAALVQRVGKGRVSYYRQPVNRGIFANWNTCIERSRGRWVHILSDDDEVLPGFYTAYQREMEQQGCDVAIAPSLYINEHGQTIGRTERLQPESGILNNALWLLASQNPIRTPGIVVARQVYEQIGGFTTDLVFTPDWEMWARIAAHVPIAYLNQPYSHFRMHTSSETSRLVLTATSITDSLAAAQVIQNHFQEAADRRKQQQAVHRWLSQESVRVSRQFAHTRHYQAALRHALWVLKLTPNWAALRNLIKVLLKIGKTELDHVLTSPTGAIR